MAMPETAWSRHQHARWMRPDAERWQKPASLKKARVCESGDTGIPSFELKVLQLATAHLRVAVADLRFALTLDGLVREIKYRDDQARVPAGDPRGGQWTANGEGGSDDEDEGDSDEGISKEREKDEDGFGFSDIFSALGDELREAFPFLDLLNDHDRTRVLFVSDSNNPNGNPDPFPQIPEQRPGQSGERTAILKDLAGWIGRNARKVAGAADAIYGAAEQVDWLAKEIEALKSYRDAPARFEELQDRVGSPSQRGYQDHHIVERNATQDGISGAQINGTENVVRIPVLKHYEITGYYNSNRAPLPDGTFGSPREYLRDKSFEERREFGLDILRQYGVMK